MINPFLIDFIISHTLLLYFIMAIVTGWIMCYFAPPDSDEEVVFYFFMGAIWPIMYIFTGIGVIIYSFKIAIDLGKKRNSS